MTDDSLRLTIAADIMDGDWVDGRGMVVLAIDNGDHVVLTFGDGTTETYRPNDEVHYE